VCRIATDGRAPTAEAHGAAILPRVIEQTTLYDRAGGSAFFENLVERFYEGVASDPVLRPLYPEADLAGARQRLTLFLIQYWGGPRTYDELRGHPRLRMRHAPFAIDAAARDRWLVHMRAAIAELTPPGDVAAELERYFDMAAEAMRNRG
jgi:hemoglobin